MGESLNESRGIGCYGFGCALAMVISFDKWHSVGWAILHGILSWFYVLYYAIRFIWKLI